MKNLPARLRKSFAIAISVVATLTTATAQNITVFNDQSAFETAVGPFTVLDDFSFGVPFLDVVTESGAIANQQWLDIARDPGPNTVWATPFGSLGWGGIFDNSEAGIGGGLRFELDFGSNNILTVPGHIPGDADAVFFGFTADQPFVAVRVFIFDSQGGTLQETHTFDDMRVQVTPDRTDLRFIQSGTGAWDTASHWDLDTTPGAGRRIFLTPEEGSVVSGPTEAATVRQLTLGGVGAPVELVLDAGGPLTVERGAIIRAGGVLSGAGQFDADLVMDAGTRLAVADGESLLLSRTAPDSFRNSGDIAVGSGELQIDAEGSFQLGATVEIGGGSLRLANGTGFLTNGGLLQGHGEIDGAVNFIGTSRLEVQDGVLTVGDLSMTGGSVLVREGASLISQKTDLLTLTHTQVRDGGSITAAGQLRLQGTSTLGSNTAFRGDGITIAGTLNRTGSFDLDAQGGELVVFSNIASLAGDRLAAERVVVGGTLGVAQTDISAVGGFSLAGGALSAAGTFTLEEDKQFTVSSGQLIASAGTVFTVNSAITGNGAVTLLGDNAASSVFRVTGDNTHGGGFTVRRATLEVASDANLGAPDAALNLGVVVSGFAQPATLRALDNLEIAATRRTTFNSLTVDTNGFDVVFNQPASGRGLTKTGAGSLVLNTANTTDAGDHFITIFGGELHIGVDNALGPRAIINRIDDGAVLDLAGFDLEVREIRSGRTGSEVRLGGGALTIAGGSSIDGIISGDGAVILGREGISGSTIRFNSANTFSGDVTVRAGSTLLVADAQSLGAAGNTLILDNGFIGTSSASAGPLVIDDAVNLVIGPGGAGFSAQANSVVIERQLSGDLPFRFNGGSNHESSTRVDVLLARSDNDFVGDVVVGGGGFSGTLGIVADGSLGDPSNALVLGDGGSFQRSGLRAHADLTLPEERTIQINGRSGSSSSGGFIDTQDFTVVIKGGIAELTENMSLLKHGFGTLQIGGVNTYTGTTLVNQGTLAGSTNFQRVEVFSAGRLAPGSAGAAGTMTVGQNLMLFGSTLAFDIGGVLPGIDHDFIEVAGLANLGNSRLEINLFGNAANSISPTEALMIMWVAGGFTGTFSNLIDGRIETSDGLGSFAVQIDGGALMLSDFAYIPEPSAGALILAAFACLAVAVSRRRS